MTNTMSDLVGITNHAAAQTDRWLFIAILVVGGFVAWLSAKWLAAQYNRIMDQWRADMKAMQDQILALHRERVAAAETWNKELREISREASETGKEMIRAYAEAVSRNSAVMADVHSALGEIRATVAKCVGGANPR